MSAQTPSSLVVAIGSSACSCSCSSNCGYEYTHGYSKCLFLNKSEHWQGICKGPRSLESGPFCSALTGYLGGPFFRSDSINGVEPNAA